jgi:hypothetical protein
MKKIILMIMFFAVLSAISANAQVEKYYILKECSNVYNHNMQAFNGWTEWENCKVSDEYFGRSESHEIYFSQNAFRIDDGYWVQNTAGYYGETTIFTTSFIADEPNADYPFRKKVSVEYKNTFSHQDNSSDRIRSSQGTGYVYSKTPLNAIMNDNNVTTATVYFYFELGNGSKEYHGYQISYTHSVDDLAQEAKNAEDARRRQQQQTNQLIQNSGKLLQMLIKKK